MGNYYLKIKPVVVAFAFFLFLFLINILAERYAPAKSPADYTNPAESLLGSNFPKDLHFAGEPVPQNDYSIKQNLDKEFLGNIPGSSVFVLLNRAAFWFPPIESVLKRNNIPLDIKYIALEESNLTNSQSSRGAAGFWQFVPGTGIYYGLEINEEVDERYSVEKSTEAACRFFKEAYKKFGSWTIAAAAYNLGTGGIESQLKKQKSGNYYDLILNKETAKYIYRVLAFKIVIENSSKHKHGTGKSNGFYGIPLIAFKVDTAITDLSRFSVSLGYTYSLLKTFNPWLRTNRLSNLTKKTYIIKFPKKEYIKNGFSYLEGDLVREENDSILMPYQKKDSVARLPDSIKEDENLKSKKDSLKNEHR